MALDGHLENSRPARPAVIRHTPVPPPAGPAIWWLAPGLIISLGVHFVLFCLLLIVNFGQAATTDQQETTMIETKVEENTQEKNLENPDIGMDPDLPTNYNFNRKEDVSVPGPVNPTEAVGIFEAPDGAPKTVAPPPGFGGNSGQGGGVDGPIAGKGNLFGTATGMGGPKLVAGGFGGRSGATRETMVREGGGNGQSEAAVAAGLIWITQHQAPDGRWSLDAFPSHGKCNCTGFGQQNDIAGTAFGLLPLLGAGQTHKGTGKNSKYAKHVERGLKYLIAKQARDGNFGGGALYAQGLATIAMCEAYGLTSDPQLKGPAQRAVDYVANAQRDAGGWDYGPKGAGFDTSVGGWQLMALKSAQMSGLNVSKESMSKANRWLDSASSPDGGSYAYRSAAGSGSGGRMTAVGLLCRQYLGWGPRNPGLLKGVQNLRGGPPSQANKDLYYYYYATQVMHHIGGDAWDFWNEGKVDKGAKLIGMRDLLIQAQDKGGDAKRPHHRGSWTPQGDGICGAGGRMMSTSLALLTLEVYYRHLPLYRRDMSGGKDMDAQ